MTDERTAVLEWHGREYELKYAFTIVRRLRSEGISIPKIFRAIMDDPQATAEYGDDLAYVIAWLLREAGCPGVTDEQVWRELLADNDLRLECFKLFMWVAAQHFTQSDNIPKRQAHETTENEATTSR